MGNEPTDCHMIQMLEANSCRGPDGERLVSPALMITIGPYLFDTDVDFAFE